MSERQTYFQPLSPRETEIAWKGMGRDFKRIDAWHEAGQEAYDVASGSVLDVVDALTEPFQASHQLGYLLHTAVDHLHALKMLLADAKAQHTFAPYTLIRGAIEAASAALWLLRDDAPQEVALRAMKLEYMNLRDETRATRAVDATAQHNEIQRDLLQQVLTRNDMTIRGGKDKITATEMVQTADSDFRVPNAYLTWQMCSAAAHGRPWVKQVLTLFEVHDDDGLSKTLSGQLSSNQMALALALRTACDILEKARTVRSSSAP
ncbi:hypothetical protein ACFFIO_11255 [Citricoccus parietis]|uniref:DUF222 domain-containing protein n=1 Tax=Citricoccus parietis TaxID=592307 RepID=A0ABV6F6D5_9MICC